MHEHTDQTYSSQTAWPISGQVQRDDTSPVLSRLPQETRQSDSSGVPIDQPYFPTSQEATDLNKNAIGQYHEIFGDSPEWGGVLKPNELESAIGSAQNHYAYDPEPDDAARYAQAAAKMGWRIAGNQVFANGNKRTAYGLTQHMLDQNGLGHLSPIDQPDPEMVDHLIAQDSYGGEGVPPEQLSAQRKGLEDNYLNMWKQRYEQGGPTPNYQQRYPEGTYISDPGAAQKFGRWGHIIATQDEESWFEDYLRVAIGSSPVDLPPRLQKLGHTIVEWFETAPREACVIVEGGNVDDRSFMETLVRSQLEEHGIVQARHDIHWDDPSDEFIKAAGVHYSDWSDIEAKAKRLIQSGSVQILRNSANMIVGQVQGDHGNYQTEISRDDPNSQAISLWSCECKWDQFAWQRTRQWKKYEGRVCAHVLATYWLASTLPLDEETDPNTGQPEGPGGEPSPIEQQPGPTQATPDGSGMVPPATAPQPQQAAPQNAMAPPTPNAPIPGQAPGPDLIPQYPMDPALQPAVNPVSVPGQKPQTPLNPIQNPGGTFSSIHESEQAFVNGQMIQLKNEDVGQTVGLNAGQQATVPANSIGEVLGVDPTTKMVNVYYAGPQSEAGIMEPHGVTAWHWPADVIPRDDIRPPGPAVRRRS